MHLGALGVDNTRIQALAKRAKAKAEGEVAKSETRSKWVPVIALVAGVVVLGVAGVIVAKRKGRA